MTTDRRQGERRQPDPRRTEDRTPIGDALLPPLRPITTPLATFSHETREELGLSDA